MMEHLRNIQLFYFNIPKMTLNTHDKIKGTSSMWYEFPASLCFGLISLFRPSSYMQLVIRPLNDLPDFEYKVKCAPFILF